ncbi:MAG: isochorismate synthase [Saprospiraceae bacterium]
MKNTLNSYLEKNIPFALFRAPNQPVRFVAQLSPLTEDHKIEASGFHFAPFSNRENVPHFVIKNDVNIVAVENGNSIPNPTISKLEIPTFLENKNQMNVVDFPTYENHIQSYLDFFEKNETQKAIYSRIKKTELPEDFDLISFFEKIENAYPRAMVYIVNLPGLGLWAGASPEKLLTYKNGIAETVALAGTQKILEQKNIENLTWGKKEIEEHGMVVDYILKKIKDNNLEILNRSETYTSQAGAMAHLKQRFEVKITKSALPKFIQDLHPTPAVCGLPKEKALDLIYQTEPYDREYYAGYLGMVEKDAVDFYVNLRCMKINNNITALFVGGGITANSDARKEWEETELKAKTLLNILDLIEV